MGPVLPHQLPEFLKLSRPRQHHVVMARNSTLQNTAGLAPRCIRDPSGHLGVTAGKGIWVTHREEPGLGHLLGRALLPLPPTTVSWNKAPRGMNIWRIRETGRE